MKFSYLYLLVFSILSLLISCESEPDELLFNELPVFTPDVIHQFESLGDDVFFSHLAYTTKLLDDGAIFLSDRELKKIFKASPDGNLLSIIASEGRGPGEVLDITFISRSFDNSILVHDQENSKVLRFSSSGDYIEEFILQPRENGTLSEVYEPDKDYLLTVHRSFEYLLNFDLEPEAQLVIFDKKAGQYTHNFAISDRPYTRNIINDQPRGGRVVPYSAGHLRSFNHHDSSFYSLWTEEQTIARLNTTLDTTNTITFELSREKLSGEEISAIRDDQPTNLWRNMEPLLPEYKAIADDLIVDKQNNFWLKLNHRSESQKWLILSESGEKRAIVHLPKEGILTHVSDQHLGFRLDDHMFALLEPIQL